MPSLTMLSATMALSLVCLARFLTVVAAHSTFDDTVISAVSWGPDSVDVFGVADNGSVWHKYSRGGEWNPHGLYFENMNTSFALSQPTAISSQPNRMDFVYITKHRTAHLRYWLGHNWNPPSPEDLGGDFSSPIAAASWAPDRLNIVGRGADMNYWHSFWDGERWMPSEPSRPRNGGWEDLGGHFGGQAALSSWEEQRMAVFGITPGGVLMQKIWNGTGWLPSGMDWQGIGGGPFVGAPAASSWGPGRLDVWAVGVDKHLYHKFWESGFSSDWESLGGSFTVVPQVVHRKAGRTDIVGKFNDKSGCYYYKFWDGKKWNPSSQSWSQKRGDFASQAAIASSGEKALHIFGIDMEGILRLQTWNGSQWLPSAQAWFRLGSTRHPFRKMESSRNEEL